MVENGIPHHALRAGAESANSVSFDRDTSSSMRWLRASFVLLNYWVSRIFRHTLKTGTRRKLCVRDRRRISRYTSIELLLDRSII